MPLQQFLNDFTLPRKLVLAALLLHFISLFFPYIGVEREDVGSPLVLDPSHVVGIYGVTQQQTGFELLPWAKWVVGLLFAVFASSFYENKLWQRFGYWLALVLLFAFAYGGAPLGTTGGKMASIAILIVLIAAVMNLTRPNTHHPSPNT